MEQEQGQEQQIQQVGVRELRENLATYINSTHPIAIMKHSEVIGYYIPVRPDPSEAQKQALERAATRLDMLLKAEGVNEDEAVKEFQKLQKTDRHKR